MTKNPEFIISRVFNATREKLWEVWTQPEHMAKWFSPKGMVPVKPNMDFRVGGTYHYGLSVPEAGFTMWGKFTYKEITPPSRLVYINAFSDENGGLGRHPLAPEWPQEMITTVTFEEAGEGKAKLTIHWVPYNANDKEIATFAAGMDSMKQGWSGTFEQLEVYLKH